MKISNLFGSVTNPIEKFLQPPSLVFSLIVLYQGLFSGNAVVIPQRLKVLFGNKFFRLFSLFLITLTSSRDVEYATFIYGDFRVIYLRIENSRGA